MGIIVIAVIGFLIGCRDTSWNVPTLKTLRRESSLDSQACSL